MSRIFNLEASQHRSSVLSAWLASREGAAQRLGHAPQAAAVLGNLSSYSSNDGFWSLPSSSGAIVTESTAMQVSTVYACLSRLAAAITSLPVHHYRMQADGERERLRNTPLWWMLNESPEDSWTAASWKEWIVRSVSLRGDQYTQIIRKGPTVGALRPLHSDHVNVRRVDRRLRYDVMDRDTGEVYGVDQDDMLHFTGFGFDGIKSMSVIQWAARQAIGNALAASDYSGKTLAGGGIPRIALEFPNRLNAQQSLDLRDTYMATYGPGARPGLPLVLGENGKVHELSISPVDMDLMRQRQFERHDICQTFGVPPIIIGDSEKTSSWGTGIEQIMRGFVMLTVQPHITRWTEELNRKLFRRAGQFVEFNLDAALAGDSKTQAEYFRAALGGPGTGNGWMSVAQVRRLKNMPRLDGTEKLYVAEPPISKPNPKTDPNQPENAP